MTGRSRIRSIAALALLGAICLGSACHFWHHLTDPACGSGRGAQPCATCAALHGAGIAGGSQVAAAPRPVMITAVALPEIASPASPIASESAARAPPGA